MRKKSLDAFKKAVREAGKDLLFDIGQAVVDELSHEAEFCPSLSIDSKGITAVWLAGECLETTTWSELITEFIEDADFQEEGYVETVVSELRRTADEIEKRCNEPS